MFYRIVEFFSDIPERGMLTNVTFPDLCVDVPIRGSFSVRKKFCTISDRHWSATETCAVEFLIIISLFKNWDIFLPSATSLIIS